MANLISEIVEPLTQIKLAIVAAKLLGLDIPPALTNVVTTATDVLASAPKLEMPNSLAADLADAATIASSLTPLLQDTSLGKFVTALRTVPATAANLAAGQFAVGGIVGATFDGKSDRVIIGAYRESGAFAQIVDQGVTDANDVTKAS